MARACPTKVWLRSKMKTSEELNVPTSSVVLMDRFIGFASMKTKSVSSHWCLLLTSWDCGQSPDLGNGPYSREKTLCIFWWPLCVLGHFYWTPSYWALAALGFLLPFCRGWLSPSLSLNHKRLDTSDPQVCTLVGLLLQPPQTTLHVEFGSFFPEDWGLQWGPPHVLGSSFRAVQMLGLQSDCRYCHKHTTH